MALQTTALLSILLFPSVFAGGPAVRRSVPALRRSLPGTTKGKAESWWISPYVLATKYFVAGKGLTTVSWFDESGHVTRELTGPKVDVETGYIYQWSAGRGTIHDVKGRWQFVLPKKPGPAGCVTAVGDTFVQQYHPVEGQIAADIYLAGKLTGSVGPFIQYKGRFVRLSNDGSLAFLTWKTEEKEAVEAVVVTPEGNISFQVESGGDADDPHSVCRGKGVLLRVTGREEPPVRFRYFAPGMRWRPLDVGPNAFPIASMAIAHTVLFCTLIGYEERFKLINCATGRTHWEIASPVRPFRYTVSQAVVIKDTILFVGEDFAAVGVRDGKVVSRWQPNAPRADRGRLVRSGERAFLVTDETFTEVRLDDIAAQRNGWKSP